jgi:predicted nucleotidyltransferase
MPLLSLQCGVTDQAMTVLGYGMALVGVVFVNGLALRAKDLEPDFDVLKMKKETFLQNKKIKEFPEELAELIGRGKQD